MKKNFVFYACSLAVVLVLAGFAACEEESDTLKPSIELIEPAEGEVLLIGADVHFEMALSDNEQLGSYKIEIHPNFDGHDHDTKAEAETEPFYFERSWDVSGKKNTSVHHHEIVIPENATPGDYHLIVYCADAAGNESHIALNIELSHEGEHIGHDHDD
ncbi:MAG: DUF4625 domain-containing protein [Tannerella sp.]|nr:DUF4625 domain-containing protein [Tannerella sp.]